MTLNLCHNIVLLFKDINLRQTIRVFFHPRLCNFGAFRASFAEFVMACEARRFVSFKADAEKEKPSFFPCLIPLAASPVARTLQN